MRNCAGARLDLLLGVREGMSGWIGWFRDIDGVTRRLRWQGQWTEQYAGPEEPADLYVRTLAHVDGEAFAAAGRRVQHACHGDATDGEVLMQVRCLTDTIEIACRGTEILAVYRVAGSGRAGETDVEIPLRSDGFARLPALVGPMQMSLARTDHGASALVLDADPDAEESVWCSIPIQDVRPFYWTVRLDAEGGVHGAVDRWALHSLLGTDASRITLAMVPGRLIVRTDGGVLGTLETQEAGSPGTTTVNGAALRRGLEALPDDVMTVSVGLTPEEQTTDVVITDPARMSWVKILPSGWSFQ